MKRLIFLVLMVGLVAAGPALAFDDNEVQIHGFVSQGFLKSTDNNYFYANTKDGTFEFNDFGLTVSSNLGSGLRVGIQLLARDLGDYGNDEVTVDWAYLEYRYRDALGLRFGRIKNPAALYTQSRDVDAARTFILLPQSMYNEVLRATITMKGMSMFGYMPVQDTGFELEYDASVGMFRVPETSAEFRLISESLPFPVIGSKSNYNFIGKGLLSTPLNGLKIGFAYAYFDFDVITDGAGLMIYVEKRPTWLIEYLGEKVTFAAEYRTIYTDNELPLLDVKTETEGEAYYGSASYRLSDLVEIGGYYSVSYGNKDDKDGERFPDGLEAKAWTKDTAVSTRFDLSDNWLLKFECHLMDGLNNVEYDETDPEDTAILFAVRVTTFF